jgi:TolB-like protein
VTEPSHAVFLSYASQDAEAAQRICEALRAAGIEVWFDQSALRGGDVWDQTIRKQIKTCVLFIPVISRHTHERDEGYFRLEWKLAVDRSHLMTTNKAFLLPVVVDDTREDDENVPDRFRDIHWTHLPGGETTPAFVERVRRLVSPEPSQVPTSTAVPAATGSAATPLPRERVATPWQSKRALPMVLAVGVAGALAYLAIGKFPTSGHSASPPTPPAAPASVAPAGFAPPPHSIAVLPFVNMSGDKEQEYFSEGLSEELLNALSRIDELQVAARTSSFSFKGKDVDIGTIARRLNVGAVLEGGIRRSGNTVRVTTQLINAVTGFHVWSQTYDRDLKDILAVQTDVATAVAQQLKVKLLGDEAARIEVGGTRNPQAYDANLRGVHLEGIAEGEQGYRVALESFDKAIALDPDYAGAYAHRSRMLTDIAEWTADLSVRASARGQARKAAERAVALAPDLGEAHLALGMAHLYGFANFTAAAPEYERAVALAPGNASVQRIYGIFVGLLGRHDAALAAAKRAVRLDPESYAARWGVVRVLLYARRFREALAAADDAKAINPNGHIIGRYIGELYLALGQPELASQYCAPTSAPLDEDDRHTCLALAYHALGRVQEAENELKELKRIDGEAGAFSYAEMYAQWGNTAEALRWLAAAERLHAQGLQTLRVDWLLDPIRNEPEFKALERRLDFPP